MKSQIPSPRFHLINIKTMQLSLINKLLGRSTNLGLQTSVGLYSLLHIVNQHIVVIASPKSWNISQIVS